MSKQLFKQTGPNSFQLISEGLFDRFKTKAPRKVVDKPVEPTSPPIKNPEFSDKKQQTDNIKAAYDAFEGAVLKLKAECEAIQPSLKRAYKQGYLQIDTSLSYVENKEKIVNYLKFQKRYNSNKELVPSLPHYNIAKELEAKLNAVLPPSTSNPTGSGQSSIDAIVDNCANAVLHEMTMWAKNKNE